MSSIDKLAKRALREAAERAKDNFIPCFRLTLAMCWRCWMSWKPKKGG
ncbi:TPA: hypothetical protein VGT10_001118 [Enterobacter cloacae]|nr:hypothetical protein [Enterobacter cloacae]